MLRLAFDFIITWRETRTRPNAYWGNIVLNCCKVIIRKPNILLFLTIYMTIFINLIKEEMKVV